MFKWTLLLRQVVLFLFKRQDWISRLWFYEGGCKRFSKKWASCLKAAAADAPPVLCTFFYAAQNAL